MVDTIIEINQIQAETVRVPLLGTTPMIVQRFSEKAKRQMLDAMQGRKTPKTPKDPQAEFEDAMYRFADGGTGFPVVGFKAATVGAARFYGKSVTMTTLKQALFFAGEVGLDGQMLARIEGEPKMREDYVRQGTGTNLRYRPEYLDWRTTVTVTFVTSMLTRSSVLSLMDAGGMGVGVGEWRPQSKSSIGGTFGTYRVDPSREIEVL